VAGSAALSSAALSSAALSSAALSSAAFSGAFSFFAGVAAANAFQLPVPDTLSDSRCQSSAGSLAWGLAQSTDSLAGSSPTPPTGAPSAGPSAFSPAQPDAGTPGSLPARPAAA
jgi:hypothetical protein